MRRSLVGPAVALALSIALGATPAGQVRLADESDRAAFRAWFVFLADAQFYRRAADVTDCAALVRYAVRESLRAHTPEWVRRAALPIAPSYADVRRPPMPRAGVWPLFRTGPAGGAWGEFADARTLVRYNARAIGRDPAALRPGDLLYFVQDRQAEPDHLMVFVGRSEFEPGDDWVVYHTGPDGAQPGEVRKVRLRDLQQHPAPRWHPTPANPAFVGVFRLSFL